jgi:hypothetical protein
MIKKSPSVSGVNTFLSALLSDIMAELKLNIKRFDYLLDEYFRRYPVIDTEDRSDLSASKAYLRKELLKPKLSWRFFCTGIRFFRYDSFTFHVVLHHPNDQLTSEKIVVDLTIDLNDPFSAKELKIKKALSRLYSAILFSAGVDNSVFEKLLERQPKADRGNLKKELLKDTMTWAVFCKGIHFLEVIKFDVCVILNNKYTGEIKIFRTVILQNKGHL